MKKLVTLIIILSAFVANAQKVTKKDLNALVLRANPNPILKDGFKLIEDTDTTLVYSRYDRKEVIVFDGATVSYMAKLDMHNYRGNVSMTPSGDLFFSTGLKNTEAYFHKDTVTNITEHWFEYEDTRTIFQYNSEVVDGEDFISVVVYKK